MLVLGRPGIFPVVGFAKICCLLRRQLYVDGNDSRGALYRACYEPVAIASVRFVLLANRYGNVVVGLL